MRTALIAFVLGFVAVALVAYGSATALLVVAAVEDWPTFHIEVGPLTFVERAHVPDEDSATLGPGLLVVAVAGGALNALGASLLRTR